MPLEIKFCHRLVVFMLLQNGPIKCLISLCFISVFVGLAGSISLAVVLALYSYVFRDEAV